MSVLFRCAAAPGVEPTHATTGSQAIHVLGDTPGSTEPQTTLCGREVGGDGLVPGAVEGDLSGHSDACTRCQQLDD
jgi:hypothetical protein